jgi:predicted dehydrogenase
MLYKEGKTMNIGVIGVGVFGLEHIQTLQSIRGVNLFGICDLNEDQLSHAANRFHIKNTYTDAAELLKEKELDGVIIATDEKSHEPLARLAASYGKHVLLEKPVATSIETAENLVKLDKDSESIIMPGHMLRFDPGYARVKEALNEQKDKLKSLKVKRNVPVERFNLHSRTHPVFMALSHDIDQIIWNTSSLPKRIYAMQRQIDHHNETPGILFGLIEFEDGLLCSLETQWCLPNEYGQYLDVEFEAMMDKGHLKFHYPGDNIHIMQDGQLAQPDIQLTPEVHGVISGALRNELEHFLGLMEGSAAPVITMEEAAIGVKISEGLIRSASEKREIQWKEL